MDLPEKKIRVGCPAHNCGGRCLLIAHVRDGRIVQLETDDRPDTIAAPQLRACVRGRAYLRRQTVVSRKVESDTAVPSAAAAPRKCESDPHFTKTGSVPHFASEGDVNLSPRRTAWQAAHVGPKARAMLARDSAAFLHQSLSTPCLDALAEAEGVWLTDADGARYMDFHGNNVHQVGYRHPRVLAAVQEALGTLPFSPRRFANRYATELAERLGELAPDPLGKVLFAPGGTLVIGMALKLARVATGRHKTVSLWDSFHGASLDAISIGGEAVFRKGIGPLLPGAEHAPPCDPNACPFGCGARCSAKCADYVAYMLDKEGDVAAVVIETVRCTDVQVPPPDYYRGTKPMHSD